MTKRGKKFAVVLASVLCVRMNNSFALKLTDDEKARIHEYVGMIHWGEEDLDKPGTLSTPETCACFCAEAVCCKIHAVLKNRDYEDIEDVGVVAGIQRASKFRNRILNEKCAICSRKLNPGCNTYEVLTGELKVTWGDSDNTPIKRFRQVDAKGNN